MKLIAVLFLFTTLLAAQTGESWYGVLEVPGQQLPLNLELTESSGSLQSPGQSLQRIPFSTLKRTVDSLFFTVNALQLSYAGKYASDSVIGTFQQATFTTQLIFYREPPAGYAVDTSTAPAARPQEPTDFPYVREAITFPGGEDSVTLAGELTLPTDTLPKALLIFVSGSGPQDRNEDLGPAINHRPFLVLSDYLTRRGYGVLRYDDRGIGESTGDFGAATSADFAQDARAALRYLRDQAQFSKVPIGILGHSEGGMIAPMVAVEDSVNFLVLLAAPGIPIDSLLLDQQRAISGTIAPDESVRRAAYRYAKLHAMQSDTAFVGGLMDTILQLIPSLSTEVRKSIVEPEDFAASYVSGLSSPWMRYFLAFDPADYLERVTVPVLAINGELDRQVTIGNLAAVGAALERAGNEEVTLVAVPGVNHLMQPAETGSPGEYGEIEVTIDPQVLEAIVSWLDARYL
ncbi:alpha/beta hydrolase family protein [Neolewinella sp.]|uniref:alpha/beta hydrolase family protein n=1 Tax=Neolewinella sp. TaxID=2993543 RepID=UPI003B51567D